MLLLCCFFWFRWTGWRWKELSVKWRVYFSECWNCFVSTFAIPPSQGGLAQIFPSLITARSSPARPPSQLFSCSLNSTTTPCLVLNIRLAFGWFAPVFPPSSRPRLRHHRAPLPQLLLFCSPCLARVGIWHGGRITLYTREVSRECLRPLSSSLVYVWSRSRMRAKKIPCKNLQIFYFDIVLA